MSALDSRLRSQVEKIVLDARSAAEAAARVALDTLAVNRDAPFATMDDTARNLRTALRARARALGNGALAAGLGQLMEEVAYEQWHRMLFARFLAENELLMHPAGLPVSLNECAELAAEEGEPDSWGVAAKYAAAMLPGIFRNDDPSVRIRLAPEGRAALEQQLRELPHLLFTADDGLGWVYQFWQSARNAQVNDSGRKVGGTDIAPVTQRFTEDYMVRFLLDNTLGAWWAQHHPNSPLIGEFFYLRRRSNKIPAAGRFSQWPERAALLTVFDPCCGSGHFLAAALRLLVPMRIEEEGLDPASACDAVLRDNLFGLELDPRCVQIAAFQLALLAWRIGGYRTLPPFNLACSGVAVRGQLDEWLALAGGNVNLELSLRSLYHLFTQATDLGSLINPQHANLDDRLFGVTYEDIAPVLEAALKRERDDPAASVFGAAAEGAARAVRLLSKRYTLVATNVPYLGRGEQAQILRTYCERYYPTAKADLAAVFVERCRAFATHGGTCALVTPLNWLQITAYADLRAELLRSVQWEHVSQLGQGAFDTIGGGVVNVALLVLNNQRPATEQMLTGIDATSIPGAAAKAKILVDGPLVEVSQASQAAGPDARITLQDTVGRKLLAHFADSYQGIKTGDDPRYRRFFWELPTGHPGWRLVQGGGETNGPVAGLHYVLDWRHEGRNLARLQGLSAWDRQGVALHAVSSLAATPYLGVPFMSEVAAIVPQNPSDLPAIRAFCRSEDFRRAVRKLDNKVAVTNATLTKVPFDRSHWDEIATQFDTKASPDILDPTQWTFAGHLNVSSEPLQVGVAHILGYRWPQEQPDTADERLDTDGMLCIPSVAGKPYAAELLRGVLAAAYSVTWSADLQDRILADVGYAGKGLETWLRYGFFEQHLRIFQNRPFLWQIWDGLPDGFSVIVNYHRFDGALLDKLTYTYLGAWVSLQRAAAERGEAGADGRLVAALELQRKLALIRKGEPPHDIYVRWKPLHQQPIGWEPDLNDGVHLNIRPFVEAGVLRRKFNINWNKDRGGEVERINDLHISLDEKQRARAAAGVLA